MLAPDTGCCPVNDMAVKNTPETILVLLGSDPIPGLGPDQIAPRAALHKRVADDSAVQELARANCFTRWPARQGNKVKLDCDAIRLRSLVGSCDNYEL